MEPAIPTGIDEVDDEWLSQALGAAVSATEISQIGQGIGMISSLYRVALAGDGPDTAVIKLPGLDDAARFTAELLRLNIREVGFYKELAQECPVRVPRAYFAAVDPDTHQFVLVLEDMAACRFVDQVQGMEPTDAKQAAAELAGWHCHWWEAGGPIVERGTAVSIGDPIYPLMLPPVFAEGWAKVRASMDVPDSIRVASEGWIDALPRLLESLGTAPTTIGHGDYRADNILFDDDGRVVALDFQVIGEASAAYDLAYFVTASLSGTVASEMEGTLFDLWRDRLIAGGIPESDTAAMWDRYRDAALFCIAYPMIAARGMDLSEERQRAVLASTFERFTRAAEELNLLDLL